MLLDQQVSDKLIFVWSIINTKTWKSEYVVLFYKHVEMVDGCVAFGNPNANNKSSSLSSGLKKKKKKKKTR